MLTMVYKRAERDLREALLPTLGVHTHAHTCTNMHTYTPLISLISRFKA